MSFDSLLDRLWGFDAEIFAHDSLFVFISYRTKERFVFHNCEPNKIQNFINTYNPILIGYNCNNYDKYILKCWLAGYTPEELKEVNDYIINGGKGWEIDCGYVELPIMWDLFNEIVPRKSLKEVEGNLRLDITETTVPFDLPTKWTKEQYEEVVYYCTCDVKALFPLFDKLIGKYKSKYIISNLGHIDPEIGLSYTNTKLTAVLLGAKRKEYDDPYKYVYPDIVDKTKIPKEALEYIDDLVEHNSLDYKREAPLLHLKDIDFQIGEGGGHAFKKTGVYSYDKSKNRKLLCNFDVSSLYPNIVRIFGYSSRSQSNKQAYVDIVEMRMKTKKNQLSEEFLKSINTTNKELKGGLKLPINSYTGGLRAKFSELYDPVQGFSICVTGQLLILQLIHDLEKIPTLEMVSANTDAVMFEIDKEYKPMAIKVLDDWQELTGLELEEDDIVKIFMRDVNNYCELVQTDDGFDINYKGGEFEANSIEKNLKLLWNKETKTFDTTFTDDVKTNSRSIVGEALLKKLLLDIPVEETINNCNDIFRFQIISHLGTTYEKCVQESTNGDIELQRNNRIYAGKIPSGAIIKVKPNGRRDSLASQPPNPIIDNGNKCTIENINKEWYIEIANQRVSDFLGIKRLEEYKKDELVTLAEELGLDIDKKTKKADLIKIIKEKKKGNEITMATKQELEEKLQKSLEQNEKLVEKLKEKENGAVEAEKQIIKPLDDGQADTFSLLHKIHQFRKKVRERNFEFDKELPANLGGGEYYSIDQFYNAVQEIALEVGLDFSFETTRLLQFDKELTKPANKLPIHVATVETVAKFTDINTGKGKQYITIAQGSDTIDKAVASASSMAFRNWFYKNFTPKNMSEEELDEKPVEESKPKVPVYVPEKKKEEIKKEVVKQVQQENSDDEDIKAICENIMKIREYPGCEKYGDKTLPKLMSGNLSSADILEIDLKVKQKLKKVQNG